MSRQSAAKSSDTHLALPLEFAEKWGTECLTRNIRFPLPTLQGVGYSVKLKKRVLYNFISSPDPPVLQIDVDEELINNTLSVIKGSNVSLNCSYQANPSIYQLTWFHEVTSQQTLIYIFLYYKKG